MSPGSRKSPHSWTQDPNAFAEFYRARYKPIVAYFARRVLNGELALDLTAETFAQAFISRGRFRGSTSAEAEAWLFRIAERKLARYLRSGQTEQKALRRLGIEAPPVNAKQRAEVDRLADLVGLRSLLRSELMRLSRSQQQALHLRVVEDLPYAAVAERLAISEPAARARVARGLKQLAASIDRNELIEGSMG